ncbi:hypothetical protein CDD81_672 [Ophiocordyceps australis]|uniref:IMP-specific 5'-nucleotidase 1 n=1 Tax=Ophiocordyceps australis TaxID=1399860 RepID=A0A2C5XG02_9HYPO|nr:hypothetical protein CDD81_672 [Ophiocordyceps australis]
MTTRYRVEYALKTHRRDQFIEWLKGLLAVPFVLYSQPTGLLSDDSSMSKMANEAHRRYAEIMHDVEGMIEEHIAGQQRRQGDRAARSKLAMLVPTAGPFFTRLPLEAAFKYQDGLRHMSSRRYVAPSFNDVRQVLNTAQLMAVTGEGGALQLATFDGDVTLYDDGQSLEAGSPVISRLVGLLEQEIKVGIVTAAGYPTAEGYYRRLRGLLDEVAQLGREQQQSLVIMGGEANYLYVFDGAAEHRLAQVARDKWLTADMARWELAAIDELLDAAEAALGDCVRAMQLPARVVRKERAVGIVPWPSCARIARESLEETVLAVQRTLDLFASPVPFCAFNGGRDVFVDIGDKSWGVAVCQQWFGSIPAHRTLHVGDQFLSAGSNDFKARSVGTTAWIANPAETVELLDQLAHLRA